MNAKLQTGVEEQWYETSMGILFLVKGHVQFFEDFDHWHNGLCRILEIPSELARKLIEEAVHQSIERCGKLPRQLDFEERCRCLQAAVAATLPLKQSPTISIAKCQGADLDGLAANKVFAGSVSGNFSRLVVGRAESEFAWQIDAQTGLPVRADSVNYDRSYFESPRHSHCGMKSYIQHEDWRIEKARRLVNTVIENSGSRVSRFLNSPQEVSVLDVGSATGYFRKVFAELGFKHYGIDLSADAIELCRKNLGFDTWQGSLFDLPAFTDKGPKVFDMITMWDVIEHLDDPLAAVQLLSKHLSDKGLLVIRTPNLMALEAEILGDHYYSFKLDHIRYFSPLSLDSLMDKAGLKNVYMETSSHMFKGFFDVDDLYAVGKRLQGADILAAYSPSR